MCSKAEFKGNKNLLIVDEIFIQAVNVFESRVQRLERVNLYIITKHVFLVYHKGN